MSWSLITADPQKETLFQERLWMLSRPLLSCSMSSVIFPT